jgi:hypothetical protein
VVQARLHVFPRQSGVLLQNVFDSISRRQEFQHGLDGNTRPLYNRFAVADIRVDRDPL